MKKLAFLFAAALCFGRCSNATKNEAATAETMVSQTKNLELQSMLDSFKLEGSMLIVDPNGDSLVFNPGDFDTPRTPASTYKIFNSLVGLETGIIPDENFVIKWDGQKRWNEKWNADHDLKTAFKNSTVWYYQELARRVGGEKMKFWLDKAGYGNADTSGGIDQFWLNGSLKISINQQVEFLRQLQTNNLPFSQRSMDIVKKIMIMEDSNGYVLRAKTGWGFDQKDSSDIGWYVGYVNKNNQVFYFANCVQNHQKADSTFYKARIAIAKEGLKQAGAF